MLVREEITTIVKKFDENGKVVETKEEKTIKEFKENSPSGYSPLFGDLTTIPNFNHKIKDTFSYR